jgi:hypothetical protein
LDKKGLKMTTTETPFLRQVRLARCQALARELATLCAKCPMTLGSDRIAYETACKAVEADLVRVAGTPEQRALEAAVSEAEGQLAVALFEDAGRQSKGSADGVALAQQKLQALQKWQGKPHKSSEYTSEDEDTLARLRSLVASLHTDPELKNRSGTQVLAKFMEVMSLLGAL